MAINQYNNWEPRLDPVNGRMQQEPRVFAHDAVPVVIGAVNTSAADGGHSSLISGGTGYTVANGVATTVSPAGGSGLTVNVLAVDAGVVTEFEIATVGSGYSVNDVITIDAGGTNATFTITNIDIPNTQKRGCCIYVGDGGTDGRLVVKMESGNEATFVGISAGSFLPILVQEVKAQNSDTQATDVSDILAIY